MAKFKVRVCRESYAFKDIEVEAKDIIDAELDAIDEAANHEFSETDASYFVHSTELIEE